MTITSSGTCSTIGAKFRIPVIPQVTSVFATSCAASSASGEAQAPLVAWFSVHHLLALRGPVTSLFGEHRAVFDSLLSRPGHIGWRAVADMEEWRAAEAYDRAESTGSAYDDELAERMGCARGLRIALQPDMLQYPPVTDRTSGFGKVK